MTNNDLTALIQSAVADTSVADFAALCGQSQSHVRNVIQNRRAPSDAMADALGYVKQETTWRKK